MSHLGRQGSPDRWGNFFSCKHLVWPTRDEATGIENACARHYQDVYSNFFPIVRHFVECQIPYKRSVKLSRGRVSSRVPQTIEMGLSYAKAELKCSKRRYKHKAVRKILTYNKHSFFNRRVPRRCCPNCLRSLLRIILYYKKTLVYFFNLFLF